MKFLTDRSFFYGDLSVVNSESPAVNSRLNSFISKYEFEFLTDVLGSRLYKLFRDGLDLDPVDAKWTALKSGDGLAWRGLVYDDGFGNKKSPIANFIYFYWLGKSVSETTAFGEKLPNFEGGRGTSVVWKQCEVWNEMCDQVDSLFQFYQTNQATYPEFLEIEINRILKYQKINPFFTR